MVEMSGAKAFVEALGREGVETLFGVTGGAVLPICDELAIPIRLVGIGEGLGDMVPFDAEAFVEALCS